MAREEAIFRIGGAAGDGVQSAGQIMGKTLSRSGLHVVTYLYYQDIIRGGQSWYQIRGSANEIKSQGDGLDILIALNKDALTRHTNPKINEGGASPLQGVAIFDKGISGYEAVDGVTYCAMPLAEIAAKYGSNKLMKNTVALGAAAAASGLSFDVMSDVIADTFEGKGDVIKQNQDAAKEGYDYFSQHFKKLEITLKTSNRKRMLMGGGDAVGLGAVMGGLKFYAGYPMTPASSALHFLASHASKYGVFVKLPEDEIAAINMAIGGNYAGLRSMTGSSGGGFSLMVEALGMAGMMEVPLVIYESQRSGPSTGLPTKTEQGDLNLVLGASQGDFPRIVLSPRNVEEMFYMTAEALNLAEKYQTPVILMSDLYLSENYATVNDLDLKFKIDHGERAKDNTEDFKRYLDTPTGISPRAIPGQAGLVHNEDSDEHNEYGDVVSDAVTDPRDRIRAMNKRMRKMETYIKSMTPTPTYKLDGAEYAIVQWGSTQGVVEEVVDALKEKGHKVGAIEINRPFPMNPDIGKLLEGRKKVIVVEGNYTGQFNRLLKSEFLVKTELITKYDGENFYPSALAGEIESVIKR
ncbi:2-oxoacid:ferredoxin oxidoreductase subunit alpha [uncultured archaeon]|nr:2-oxoacid:ferredoxin oxidoreductase subunit alpha [uncultured archaeon]